MIFQKGEGLVVNLGRVFPIDGGGFSLHLQRDNKEDIHNEGIFCHVQKLFATVLPGGECLLPSFLCDFPKDARDCSGHR